MEDISKYVGIFAGVFTAASLVPQLYKILKEKKAENVSGFMLIILLVGLAGWVWYGLLKKDYPIVITNIFSFVINCLIIVFSFKYKQKKL